MKKIILLILIITSSNYVLSQARYWIEFEDKGSKDIQLISPEKILSSNAIERRIFFGLNIDETDFPICSRYINQVKDLDAQVLQKSKWLNGIVVSSPNDDILANLKGLEFVKRITPLTSSKSTLEPKFDLSEYEIDVEPSLNYGFAAPGIEMMNGDFLHNQGFRGQTIDIGVMDNGFQLVNTNRFFDTLNLLGKIHGVYNYVEGNTNVFSDGDHGAYVMSTLAANIKDTLIGTAPMGNYYLFATEDNNSEGLQEEINWALAAEWADSALGTWVVLTTSLGYSNGFSDPSTNHTYADMDGNTTIISRAADLAAKKGILVVNSAGNEGNDPWKYITAPADGDSVLAIGAVDEDRVAAEFSSFGPSSDGQIKPNVSALGRRVVAAKYDGTIVLINGTSFSCPITAGLAACLWQAFPTSSNMQIIEAVEQSAHLYFSPDDQLGYGIPNFKLAYDILELRQSNPAQGILVYPNPASEILNTIFIDESEGLYDFSIADASGKIWTSKRKVSAVMMERLDISDIPVGIYYLFVKQGKNKYRQKFMKR